MQLGDDADRHIDELIALASDFASARGAYDEAGETTTWKANHASAEGAGD